MPVSKNRIVAGMLTGKFRFSTDETDHTIFILWHEGRRMIDTKLSHGSRNSDISRSLFSKIARDLGLTTRQLQDAIGCTLSRDEYLHILRCVGV